MRCEEKLDAEQLRAFYEAEKRLAQSLREAPRSQRLELYGRVYDELYQTVPYHPQLQRKCAGHDVPARDVAMTMALIRRFLRRDATFLEIGAGDCAVSFAVARFVAKVFALDVSKSITATTQKPDNVAIVISDGVSVPLSQNSVDVAFSNQLMEHLHPDDAREQLRNILAALKHNGCYICLTPSALDGPHDVSRFFDEVATGLHIKEYTFQDLLSVFREAGFRQAKAYLGHQRLGVYMRTSEHVVHRIESSARKAIAGLPHEARVQTMSKFPYRLVRDVRVVGLK